MRVDADPVLADSRVDLTPCINWCQLWPPYSKDLKPGFPFPSELNNKKVKSVMKEVFSTREQVLK